MHGVADYVAGIALILAPWIFAFSDVGGVAVWVPRILGIVIVLQSLITDYELSLANILPLRAPLAMDMLGGLILALSPVIWGFTDEDANAWLPHVVVGLFLIIYALLTRPERDTAPSSRAHGHTGTHARSI